ncbi:hypothetical protein O6P43_012897 [Quillaja saponaria]|uniref:Uncharacterized protein n=1 Tax=Quillaja saponaria TaxID=32244 RepID=A0AAD7M2P8_QUISA|nr:hypothetical protein O6P43_012897 [Quillaja saponaria]
MMSVLSLRRDSVSRKIESRKHADYLLGWSFLLIRPSNEAKDVTARNWPGFGLDTVNLYNFNWVAKPLRSVKRITYYSSREYYSRGVSPWLYMTKKQHKTIRET